MHTSSWTPSIVPNDNDETVYLVADDFGRLGTKARLAAKATNAPVLAPQQTDLEDCIAEHDGAVQRVLHAAARLDGVQRMKFASALMQEWPGALDMTLDGLRERIAALLRDASKDERMNAIDSMMDALNLNIHDWVSTMTIGKTRSVPKLEASQ